MDRLIQKTILTKKELVIHGTGFSYKQSKFGNETEVIIPFENLSNQKVSFKKTELGFLASSGLFFLVALSSVWSYIEGGKDSATPDMIIGFSAVSLFLMGAYIFNRQDLWKIILLNHAPVLIHKSKPDAETTFEFYDSLIEARNAYLKENYAFLDKDLNYEDQLKNLKWLKNMGVLTKEEFDDKYAELKNFIYLISTIGYN